MRRCAIALSITVLAIGTANVARAGTCAQTISCGTPVTSDVNPVGEIDCHTFSGTAGEVVSIGINSTTGGTFSPRWTLVTPGGASVGAGTFPDRRTLTLPVDGTYTIDVQDNSSGGTGDTIGTYTVSYVVVSDAPSTCASPIACGATLETSLTTPTDTDTYSFAATAGEIASITTTETTAGINVCWELYGPSGTSLATSCTQRAVFLPQTGTHTIRVSENGDDGAGPYNVNFTIVTGPDQCATAIGCGDTPSPAISPRAESDTFAFTTALDTESVRIITTGAGGAFSPCWTIFAQPGVGATPGATPTPVCGQAQASLPHAGTHVIRVSDANDDATGPYGLGLECLGTPTPTFTPNPTLTPSATGVTPTPTPTQVPTQTLTPDPNATATPVGPPQGLADPIAAKQAVKCEKALMSATAKLVSSRLKRLDACATKVLGCLQTKPGIASCSDKAAVTCARGIGKLEDDQAKMRQSVVKSCSPLSAADRGSVAGLGFDAQASVCSGLGSPSGDSNGLAGCVAIRSRCNADDLMEVEEPRSAEMLRLVGSTLEPGACLLDFGGNGENVGDPGTVGGQIVQCAKAVTRAARVLATARLTRTANCVSAVLACVQLRPGDAGCVTKAAVRCGSEASKIGAAEARFAAVINKKCPAIPFQTLAALGGLDLAALNTTCTALGVGSVSSLTTYQECLRRNHACEVGEALGAAAPRAGEMLAQVGRLLLESFCAP